MISSAFGLILLFIIGIITTADASCAENFGGCDRWNGLCWDTGNGRHFCTCKAGFKPGRFGYCENVNECEENPCGENAECIDSYGSFNCRCHCGFVLDYTKTKCLNINEIEGRCHKPSWCYNYDTSNAMNFDDAVGRPGYMTVTHAVFRDLNMPLVRNPTCKCELGYQHNDCGLCVDVDECNGQGGGHSCDTNAKCMNTEGSYYCVCRDGYIRGPCGKRCYRSQLSVPESCDADIGGSLRRDDETGEANTQAVFQRSFGTFVKPIVLKHFDTCNGTIGNVITERLDVDKDGRTDVTLTWSCSSSFNRPMSLLKKYSERGSYWGQWTCWTECKATCWGGIQTRSRRCWYGVPGRAGCPGSGSEKKTCFTGKRCPMRVRKDMSTLTDAEKNDLMQAMEKYKDDMSATGFHNAASSHGWPFQCNGESCCPHSAKMHFLTWHRTITFNFEQGLIRHLKSKTLGIPYWNWLSDDTSMPELTWEGIVNGRPNPFVNFTVFIDREGPMRTIQRDSTPFSEPLENSITDYRDVVQQLMKSETMHEFAENLELVHGGPHVVTCGAGGPGPRCLLSLGQLTFASFDPLFMFHHAQVDKLGSVFVRRLTESGNYTWTTQTVLESFEPTSDFSEPHHPFSNTSLNPFPIVQATGNMRDFPHHEELMGYTYDCNDDRGFGCNRVAQRRLRLGGSEKLFVAQYLRNIAENAYVNYFVNFGNLPCSQLTEDFHLGRILILGAQNQRPFKNTIPTLLSVAGGGAELSAPIPITACYTDDSQCRFQCPEHPNFIIPLLMPTPALVHHLPNNPVDVFKFDWTRGKRMPSWPINLKAGSQWIYFYGDNTDSIRQVPTGWALNTCSTNRGRPFPCSQTNGKACVLPPGIYYLVDSNRMNCRMGLRMYIRVTV